MLLVCVCVCACPGSWELLCCAAVERGPEMFQCGMDWRERMKVGL
jgi:hypothetical protein